MANHKSAIKRNRQNQKRRVQNRDARSAVRTALKNARQAIESGDAKALELARAAERMVAKAATKGLYHAKTASRKISRLAKAASAKKVGTPAKKAASTKKTA